MRFHVPRKKSITKNELVSATTKNGLGEAVGFQSWGYNGLPNGVQLSQVNTLFNNNRWYLVSNMRQLLSELYVEHGLIQAIVNTPVDDGLRGGIEISSKQLDEKEVQHLQTTIKRQKDLITVGRGSKWNRLFGGGGVIILTNQDPMTPLDVEAITEDSPLEFRAVDLWELFWDRQGANGYNPAIQSEVFEYYSYYGTKLHKSRVLKMEGLIAPSFIRPRLRGWGFSVVEHLVRSINQYLKANNLSFEVLDEFKVDTYKIKNLASILQSAVGQQKVTERLRIANYQKNYQKALIMDSEDDFIQKQLSFAGMADVMKEIRIQIASDMRMPLTKLFGLSATGFNSGEDDIENYNAMVESEVRDKIEFDILRVVELRCQQLFGYIPDDLAIEFKPLRVLSSVEEEQVKTSKFTRVFQASQQGLITTEEFRDACNRDNLLGIQLENTGLILKELESMAEDKEESDKPDNKKKEE